MGKCKICDEKTNSIFNIDFKAVHICESCAVRIFLQQAHWYAKQRIVPNKKQKVKVSDTSKDAQSDGV